MNTQNKLMIEPNGLRVGVGCWSNLNNPHQMMVGSQYKITEPVYDDYDEGLQPETDLIEVVNKTRYGFILRNIEHDFTYERTFQHLMTCEIIEV